jgi:hypothetical protein
MVPDPFLCTATLIDKLAFHLGRFYNTEDVGPFVYHLLGYQARSLVVSAGGLPVTLARNAIRAVTERRQ